jgi:hypothetical protein
MRPSPNQMGGFGIPEPELVDEAGGAWRSQFDGTRWQVNAAHEDYVSLRGGRTRALPLSAGATSQGDRAAHARRTATLSELSIFGDVGVWRLMQRRR